ncbi:MAG TPA: LysR substrate-binding domain-containing protein [Vicinamibacterales bacterium]|nr:LysR substrate-binding domain-containing protein [Vicinamibacterales bacterium]
MELDWLHTFAAVAELRHFARAAARCNLSQPAVSHQIRLLETELGARLLNRSGRRVSLTVAGELFLEDARRILAGVDRAKERVQNVAAGALGRVRIGATETAGLYLLPLAIERYRRAHPRFALQLAVGSETSILERVAANDLDMALVCGAPVLGELQARRIGGDELVIAARGTAPIARRRQVKPADLRDEPWVIREEGSDTRRRFDAWAGRQHVSVSQFTTLSGPDAVKRAIVAGLGIGLISRTVVAEELRTRQLAAVRVTAPVGSRDVLLVDHPNKHHGAACTAMIDLLARTVTMIAVALACAGAVACQSAPAPLVLATTTSVANSGLLDPLLAEFQKDHGVVVRSHLVGSGLALRMLAQGEADVAVTHAPETEAAFLRDHPDWRARKIMFNDFVLVGPPADPAKVSGVAIEEAMRRIAQADVRFISRGDNSGTHERENQLWELVRMRPPVPRLVRAGAGMGSTLRVASETASYTLTDRATYLQIAPDLELKVLVEGGPLLINTYSVVIPGSKAAATIVRATDAEKFFEWISRGRGRAVIAAFRIGGVPAFTPWPASPKL